jgi:hypothetical protein
MTFANATAPGLGTTGIIGSTLAAMVCALIFASCVTSKDINLRKITAGRVPMRWWCVALFTPALVTFLVNFFMDFRIII